MTVKEVMTGITPSADYAGLKWRTTSCWRSRLLTPRRT